MDAQLGHRILQAADWFPTAGTCCGSMTWDCLKEQSNPAGVTRWVAAQYCDCASRCLGWASPGVSALGPMSAGCWEVLVRKGGEQAPSIPCVLVGESILGESITSTKRC